MSDPDYDPAATSSAQDDLVVEVHTDEGIVGIGETDLDPWIARECIEAPGTHTMDRGLGSIYIGLDPRDPPKAWWKAYQATAMTGRRGGLTSAMGAIDIALWTDHLDDYRALAESVPTDIGRVGGFRFG